jgi:hypothetical protein
MANGAQCCALEICCPPELRRERLMVLLTQATGADEEYCGKFLDWMDHEELIFAPAEFQTTIDAIARIAKKHISGS